jgi:DNA-binding SARP family transcriptional activator/CRP-like cAMP-binding protein
MSESIIAEIPLFASLTKKARGFLLKVLQPLELPPHEVLFREGDPADRFYIVMAGQLEAIKAMGTPTERLLNLIGPGDYIGEIAFLLADGLRTASVRANADSQLLAMNREAFAETVERFPSVGYAISCRIAARLRNAENMRIQDLRERDRRMSEACHSLRSKLLDALEEGNQSPGRQKLLELLSEVELLSHGTLPERTDSHGREAYREPLKSFYRLSVPSLRIETLGGFRVLRGGIPIEEAQWKGKRPKELLKALVARQCRRVPREHIVDDLWPESDAITAEISLKVTLHRLRKILEPSLDRAYGSSYIHVHGNLLSLDPDLCQVDTEEFTSLCARGEIRQRAGDLHGALSFFKRAMDMVSGDFLPDDQYVPWVETRRHELNEKHLSLLFRTAELCENIGDSRSAVAHYGRILELDPLAERACQRLMTLYSNRGARNAAIRVYEDLRKALKNELDCEPDDLTTAIYRKLTQ